MFVVGGDTVHIFLGNIDDVVDDIPSQANALHLFIVLRLDQAHFSLSVFQQSQVLVFRQIKHSLCLQIQRVQRVAWEKLKFLHTIFSGFSIDEVVCKIFKANELEILQVNEQEHFNESQDFFPSVLEVRLRVDGEKHDYDELFQINLSLVELKPSLDLAEVFGG